MSLVDVPVHKIRKVVKFGRSQVGNTLGWEECDFQKS